MISCLILWKAGVAISIAMLIVLLLIVPLSIALPALFEWHCDRIFITGIVDFRNFSTLTSSNFLPRGPATEGFASRLNQDLAATEVKPRKLDSGTLTLTLC